MSGLLYKSGYHRSWALLVGINQYRSASPLSYAVNDVEALAHILIDSLGFPEKQVVKLIDSKATKERIKEEFDKFHLKANNPDDRLLFFFAGHGCTVQGNRRPVGYLVPVDGKPDTISSLICWDDLTRTTEIIPAKHILFIMDACYSGLALQRVAQAGVTRFVSDLLQRYSRQVITAGKADQTVADGGGASGKNSLFTSCLIEGLDGAASNSEAVLSAGALMAYVYQKVGQNAHSNQTPHYGHLEGDGDFIFKTPKQEHLVLDSSVDYQVEQDQEIPEEIEVTPSFPQKKSFAIQCGYVDANHPNFGRNDYSRKLGEFRVSNQDRHYEKAFSWLGIVLQPFGSRPVVIDIAAKARQPSLGISGGEPYERFRFPSDQRTTSNSLLFYSEKSNTEYWTRYLRIEASGNIEYADSDNVFLEVRELRMFRFVQIIGTIWQLLFLAKGLLAQAGYLSGVQLTVGLVGTRESALVDFSQEPGTNDQRWRDPIVDPFGTSDISARHKCTDSNLVMVNELIIGSLSYERSVHLMKSISRKIELAYNHHTAPRSFNFETDDFPWNQYLQRYRT